MNPSQSDLTGTSVTFESLASGEWQSSSQGVIYKFRMDGKDYPTGMGDTARWKALDSGSWQTTWKANGKTITTDTLKIGPDGKTLTMTSKGKRPNGEAIDDSAEFQRVSGGPGLAGKWKSTTVKTSPDVMEMIATGDDGVLFKQPAWGVSCDAKLDGKDYPCTTPLGPGWTIAMIENGVRTIGMVVKKDAKPFVRLTLTVSADGKSMMQLSEDTATHEKTRMVYDRQ